MEYCKKGNCLFGLVIAVLLLAAFLMLEGSWKLIPLVVGIPCLAAFVSICRRFGRI